MQPANMSLRHNTGNTLAESCKIANFFDKETRNNVLIEETDQMIHNNLQIIK